MRRATLLLDDTLYERAKELSIKKGRTLKEVLNELLRFALQALPKEKVSQFEIPLHRKNGPQPGIDIADRNSLYDFLDEER